MDTKRFSVAVAIIVAVLFVPCLALNTHAQDKHNATLVELKQALKTQLDVLVLEQTRVAEQILINTDECESAYRQWYAADRAYEEVDSRIAEFVYSEQSDYSKMDVEAQSGQIPRLLEVMRARERAGEISTWQRGLVARYYIISDTIDEVYRNACRINIVLGTYPDDSSAVWPGTPTCARPMISHLRMVVVEKEEISSGVANSAPVKVPRLTPPEVKACLLEVMTIGEWEARVLENRPAPEAGFSDLLDSPGMPGDVPRRVDLP